jgi:exosortase A-associated hydrolase 2
MNKARHVLAAIVQGIARAGHQVLLPDLFGTGDSTGDFGDATIDIWRGDLDLAVAQMASAQPLDVVGLRFGALLAADLAARHPVRTLTLLQPLGDGRQQLTQMLRLRLAAGLMGGGTKETVSGLRQRLAEGETIEIAGYRLSGVLAAGLESLTLEQSAIAGVERVNWIEVAADANRPLMPVSQRIIGAWSTQGIQVDGEVVECDQFWATQEIAHCPAMVDRALQRLVG